MQKKKTMLTRYLPFGDSALLIELGDAIDLETNIRVIALNDALLKTNIQGVEELVPTYRSLLVRYDPQKTSYEKLIDHARDIEKSLTPNMEKEGKRVLVPVVYGGKNGPDLSYVAKTHGLTEEQAIKLHSGETYRVYMIGFVAGFPYLGEVVDEIATPRLETPRLKVPAGSVGIAEKQTGIYPCEAPGGWQIIGRTAIRLFNPANEPPALLSAGDSVKFKPISEKEYNALINGQ
jgi:inhibitor of KinA